MTSLFGKDEKKPIFNAGLAKLERIHELHRNCHLFRVNKMYSEWFSVLCGLRNELDERMSEDEVVEAERLEKNIRRSIESPTRIQPIDKFPLLHRYERHLFRTEARMGFSVPDEDDRYG